LIRIVWQCTSTSNLDSMVGHLWDFHNFSNEPQNSTKWYSLKGKNLLRIVILKPCVIFTGSFSKSLQQEQSFLAHFKSAEIMPYVIQNEVNMDARDLPRFQPASFLPQGGCTPEVMSRNHVTSNTLSPFNKPYTRTVLMWIKW